MTCEDAIIQGLLYASLENGTATVHNNANESYTVSLASYEMYAALIDDQKLFDSDTKTVASDSSTEFNVEIPVCAYQIDIVCGEPLAFTPQYGKRVVNFTFAHQEAGYCVPTNNDGNVTLNVKAYFPQGGDYVFECNAQGFTPTQYFWYFGDGQIMPNYAANNVFHSYEPGTDNVSCIATDGVTFDSDSIQVTIAGSNTSDNSSNNSTVCDGYWYDNACHSYPQTFKKVFSGGGSSGGGGGGCAEGYLLQNGICVKKKSVDTTVTSGSSPKGAPESLQGQSTANPVANDAPVVKPTADVPKNDTTEGNLVTGNVAGAGRSASALWLGLLVCVIAGALVFVYFQRRN